MKATLIVAVLVGVLAAVGGRLLLLRSDDGSLPRPDPSADLAPLGPVSANGTVEGARPEVALRPEVTGVLTAVHVRENDKVTRGQVLAEVSNQTHKHQVALARAELAVARQQLERLRNGERAEKRQAAAAVETAKKVLYEQGKADHDRNERSRGGISQQQRDADYFRMLQLKAEWEQARAERQLVEAPPRPEDVAVAEAQVAAAEARLRLAEAELAKTRLTAPADGRVLQLFAEPGEVVAPTSARPVLILADLSRRRVRAFVEELDVARVAVGQDATVTADGLPDKAFAGKVAVVLPRMGTRAPMSDAPGEYKDVYFREVLVDLDAADELPLNLRVQVRIQVPAPSK